MVWRLSRPPTSSSCAEACDAPAAAALPTVARGYYLEHPAVAALTADQADAIRQKAGIRTVQRGSVPVHCPNPVGSFLQASFPQYMLDALAEAGFTAPTSIQRQGWPVAMMGHDLIGLAETGSGKTLTYLLPALVHVAAQPVLKEGDGPIALAIAPTRELAVQIHEECVRFGVPCGVRTACVYGGVPKVPQIQELRKAPEVLVATPGRLCDLLAARKTKLCRCTYFVVDEADRMLDLGFEPQLRTIVGAMRDDRQTLMFSATWPQEVQTLADAFLAPSVLMVEVGGALADAGKANVSIEQRLVFCAEESKLQRVVELLEQVMDGSRILIFAASKRRCDELTRALRIDGWPALAIHGDKSQEERDWVLHQFKEGEQPLLVATDVAQRGLDIKEVRHVVNYDCPSSSEAYVHRIGRTGRAGESGVAHTFVTPTDARVAPELAKVLRSSGQDVPAELERLVAEHARDAQRHGRAARR